MIAGTAAPPRARAWNPTALALAVVWLAALGIRLFGLEWDDGRDLHPDELFVAKIVLADRIRLDWPPDVGSLLDPETSGLNPRSADPVSGQPREFAYGALPLFVTDAVAAAMGPPTDTNWNAPDRAYLVGRTLSALLDSLTVLVVAATAWRLAGPRAGLLGAAVYAGAPMMIQLSHFFTTDSWLTFFVAVCLWQCVAAIDTGRLAPLLWAGAASGLAMATKGSVFTLFGVVALSALLQGAPDLGRESGRRAALARAIRRTLAAGVAALIGFALFEPYAIMRPAVYLQSLATQADIVRGKFDVPFTRQFVDVWSGYPLDQLAAWGIGPVAALFAAAGLAMLGRSLLRERRWAAAPLLVWTAGYLVVVFAAEVRFLRYLAPVVPVLAACAGIALDRLWSWLGGRVESRVATAAAAAVLVATLLPAAAFASVHAGEHPRLAASRWMYDAIAPGSGVSSEYWDDALPRDLGIGLSAPAFAFDPVTIDMYGDRPPQQVADDLYAAMARAEVIVLSSNRVERSIGAAPWRYPVQREWYRLLADGSLGYRLAGEWSRPPSLGAIRFDDRNADESFINYDHPTVRVYERGSLIPRSEFESLMAWSVARPWSPTRHPVTQTLLLDEPVGSLPVVDDARWSAPVTGGTAGALAVWALVLVALQVAGAGVARRLFARFPDRGWGLGRLCALLIAGYLVWIGASLEWIAFRAAWCWIALAATAGLSWLVLRRQGAGVRSLLPASREARGAEIAFWAVFLIFLAFRVLNPDSWHPYWGGEKPMEFAHLNATLRSAHFPPYDPWFSDGYVNYYYYGTYLVAFLLKLSGIPSEIGFNLAQPLVMALLASGVFSVGAALGRLVMRGRGVALAAGTLAAVLTVIAGNLVSFTRLFAADRAPFDSFGEWVWNPSRAIEGAITEFPFFTGLYADLHAHAVALPVTVLAIGLALAIATTNPVRDRSGLLIRLAMLSLVVGSLGATNAWDVPVYAALGIAAVWMASASVPGFGRRLAVFAACSLGLAGLAYLLYLPFHRHFVALFGSLAPVADPTPPREWALHVGGLASVALLGLLAVLAPRAAGAGRRWPRASLLLVALAVSAIALAAADIVTGRLPVAFSTVALPLCALFVLAGAWCAAPGATRPAGAEGWIDHAPALLGLAGAVASFLTGRMVLGACTAGLALGATGWLFGRRTGIRFASLLAAAAFGVMGGVELVVVADDLLGSSAYRMNTVFKFYNQVWVLLAVASAALAPAAWAIVRSSLPHPAGLSSARAGWARLATATGATVVVASLAYPILAVSPRLHQRFVPELGSGSLDGLAWMDGASLASAGHSGGPISFADDGAVIDWFNREVPGSPVIAEASIGPYRCNGSRISIATGLPTILGWERHQMQQRYLQDLPVRAADVERLFASPSPEEKLGILRRYGVEYVVVGDLERAWPVPDNECTSRQAPEGIAAFEGMVGSALEVAFAAGDTVVYRVLPAGIALSTASAS